ncbi:MAG: hypothetical protein ABR981_05145 [Candidatus Micrarchaeaceae archaeon]|jgi:DNA-binding Lrp family transcriptional regulator
MNNHNQNRVLTYVQSKHVKKNYRFYFVEPFENMDANNFARKLINIKDVEEVFVTEGDYGFVVKAKSSEDKQQDNICKCISRLGGSFGKVTSHYQYKK